MREIAFAGLDIRDEDIDVVGQIIKSGWLAHGKYTHLFEETFAKFTGAPEAVAVSNCTTALHLAVLSQKIGPGDEVIVPAMTHTATAHAVEYTGAKAVFAEVEPLTGNMLPSEILRLANAKTKGVIVVHMGGIPCEMDAILAACQKHHLFLVEDCAHALGTTYKGKHVGLFGEAGCFSFYPTKQITTGEGGMFMSKDPRHTQFARTHRAFGIDTPPELRKMPGVYDVLGLGYNYRMTDFQAALGYFQLSRYEQDNLSRRKANARQYLALIESVPQLVAPAYCEDNSYFLFQAMLPGLAERTHLVNYFKAHKIGVSIHYATPVPLMSYYKNKYGLTREMFPKTCQYADTNISFPVHQHLATQDIEHIIETAREAFERVEA